MNTQIPDSIRIILVVIFSTSSTKKAKKVAENIYLKTLNGEGKYFRMFYKLGEMYSNTKIKSPVYLVNKFHKKKAE